MPKIVDRQQYKQKLATQAAQLFLKHGYSQLGMRQLALELGLSKSALYHYFPSKESLFSASLEAITQQGMQLSQLCLTAPLTERVDALLSLMQQIEQRFANEIGLVLDYIRGMNSQQVRADQHMQLAEKKYLELIAQYVGEQSAKKTYHILMGVMLGRLMDGQTTTWDEAKIWLLSALNTP
ncbi:TetR/AcrR family transcriptional regulator [Agarivorans sp. Z349TD_8]|uniref:TetR/AcrR family transcriptional regulator n=1 Tax=Agarivorans sp. Z349TD_8 TaxID=3421434 RepID=UPI003D7CE615